MKTSRAIIADSMNRPMLMNTSVTLLLSFELSSVMSEVSYGMLESDSVKSSTETSEIYPEPSSFEKGVSESLSGFSVDSAGLMNLGST